MAVADTTGLLEDEIIDPVSGQIVDQKELAQRLLAQAREQGAGEIAAHVDEVHGVKVLQGRASAGSPGSSPSGHPAHWIRSIR
jgi:putative transposase